MKPQRLDLSPMIRWPRSLTAVVGLGALMACTPEVTIDLFPDHVADPDVDSGSVDSGNVDGANVDAGLAIDPSAEAMHVRAGLALTTLMLSFWTPLSANTTYDGLLGMYWDAVLDATERRGPNAFPGTTQMFFDLQTKRGWLDASYANENWIALALLHAYAVTHSSVYLTQAKTIYADIQNALDTTCCGATPGGLWSDKTQTTKTAAINLGSVISGARLYQATQDTGYLAFAQKVFARWTASMVDRTSGHSYDAIAKDGTIDTVSNTTLDQGLLIESILALSSASGDATEVPLAHQAAAYMMSHRAATTSLGSVLTGGNCDGTGAMSKGFAARALGNLYRRDTSYTEYREFLARSANATWTLARDPSSGSISCDWVGPYDAAAASAGSLGAAAIALSAAAKAMGPGLQRPALHYEAEEANLRAIALGHDKPNFSGWGYTVGWGLEDQSLDVLVSVPTAGSYNVALRYSSQEDAARSLSVGGQLVTSTLAFPNTGSYATFVTMSTRLPLAAGHNVITIGLSAASATRGSLNLDELTLSAE